MSPGERRRQPVHFVGAFARCGTAVGWLVLLAATAARACPNCADAIADDPVGYALSWTTLLMIAVPLLVFGSIGGWLLYTYRRAARQQSATARGVGSTLPELVPYD